MISANGGLPAERYGPQVTQRWPRGSEPASQVCFDPKTFQNDLDFFLVFAVSIYYHHQS